MRKNSITIHKNQIQILLYTWGATYYTFLILTTFKVFTWFFMNAIHLIETFKFRAINHNLFDLNQSILYVAALSIIIVLWIKVIGALKQSLNSIHKTREFIASYTKKYSNTLKAYILSSSKIFAFTAGFKKPRIYISSALIRKLTKKELRAVLEHEQHHKDTFDTINTFLLKFLEESTISFPFKSTLFKNHFNIRELSADFYAKESIRDDKPLISALNKLLKVKILKDINISSFESKIERIPILLGKSKLNVTINYLELFAIINLFIFASVITMYINPTADCSNFNECVSSVVFSKNQEEINPMSCIK